MPIYEYRCGTCGSRQSQLWRSMSAVKEDTLTCAKCGSKKLSRLVSRVRMVRGGGAGGGAGSDESGNGGAGMDGMDESLMREMANVDEHDPRALGRLMRKMAAASGEDLGPEFGEVVGRLEKGEDPERIEREMGDVFGADTDGMSGQPEMGGMGQGEGEGAAEPVEKSRPKVSRRKAAAKSAPKASAAPRATPSIRKLAK